MDPHIPPSSRTHRMLARVTSAQQNGRHMHAPLACAARCLSRFTRGEEVRNRPAKALLRPTSSRVKRE